MKRTQYVIQIAENHNFQPIYRRVLTDGVHFYARYHNYLWNVDSRINNKNYYDDRNDVFIDESTYQRKKKV